MGRSETDWDVIVKGFDYDKWANLLWLSRLLELPNGVTEISILGHILSAQKIWSLRIRGDSPQEMPLVEVCEKSITTLHREWRVLLSDSQQDGIVHYKRTNGDRHSLSLSEIARHVVNHGTYHRGELRGLFRANGIEAFPETDFAAFVFIAS